MGDVAPLDELHRLTRQLRTQLRRHASLGAWAAPGGPTAMYAGAAYAGARAEAEAAVDVEPVASAPALAEAAPAALTEAALAALADAAPAEVTPAPLADAAFADAALAGDALADAALADAALADAGARFAAADLEGFRLAHEPPREPAAARAVFDPRDAPPGPAALEQAELLVPLGRRTLPQIREDLGECTRCKLHTTRRKIVFGVGAEDAPLIFIGEAPGEQEDRRGEPFVGPAGELLDKMIEAMGWTRDTVYIANILKCRPPMNRNPQPDEVAQCTPFLDAQIRALSPRIIVTLGKPAANHVLRKDAPISSLRGRFHDRAGVKVMPTFHPAYLLREPDRKKDAWSDLKQVIVELERLGIKPPRRSRA